MERFAPQNRSIRSLEKLLKSVQHPGYTSITKDVSSAHETFQHDEDPALQTDAHQYRRISSQSDENGFWMSDSSTVRPATGTHANNPFYQRVWKPQVSEMPDQVVHPRQVEHNVTRHATGISSTNPFYQKLRQPQCVEAAYPAGAYLESYQDDTVETSDNISNSSRLRSSAVPANTTPLYDHGVVGRGFDDDLYPQRVLGFHQDHAIDKENTTNSSRIGQYRGHEEQNAQYPQWKYKEQFNVPVINPHHPQSGLETSAPYGQQTNSPQQYLYNAAHEYSSTDNQSNIRPQTYTRSRNDGQNMMSSQTRKLSEQASSPIRPLQPPPQTLTPGRSLRRSGQVTTQTNQQNVPSHHQVVPSGDSNMDMQGFHRSQDSASSIDNPHVAGYNPDITTYPYMGTSRANPAPSPPLMSSSRSHPNMASAVDSQQHDIAAQQSRTDIAPPIPSLTSLANTLPRNWPNKAGRKEKITNILAEKTFTEQTTPHRVTTNQPESSIAMTTSHAVADRRDQESPTYVTSQYQPAATSVSSLSREAENLRREIDKARETIKLLHSREQKIKRRLFENASSQPHFHSNRFEDIALGENRPTLLISQYGDLYTEHRLDAIDALDELPELNDMATLKEKILFTIIVLSFRTVESSINSLRQKLRTLLQLPDPAVGHMIKPDPIAQEMEASIDGYLMRKATNLDTSATVQMVRDQLISTLYEYPSLKSCPELHTYITQSVKTAWALTVQQPPYILRYDHTAFSSNLHTRFLSSNHAADEICTFVWPCLIESASGQCVQKGVVIT